MINGVERQYDNSKLMFSEAMEIQKATGLSSAAHEQSLKEGDALAWAALYWVAEVRVLATQQQISFREAAKLLPFDTFDVNLNESNASMKAAVAAQAKAEGEPDPTETADSPSGPPETTSPGTSEPASPETTWAADAAPTSEPSPTSSASAPGSGTS